MHLGYCFYFQEHIHQLYLVNWQCFIGRKLWIAAVNPEVFHK